MVTGWRFRIGSVVGVISLTVLAVTVANHPVSQSLFTSTVPLFNRLEVTVLTGESLFWAILLSVLAVTGCLLPLYKPRPRRTLDTALFAQKRVLVATFVLATLGYFKWSHRLPRATLVMLTTILLVTIPALFLAIRRRPAGSTGRTLIVGDDLSQIEDIAPTVDAALVGYLCPSTATTLSFDEDRFYEESLTADGGVALSDSEPESEPEPETDTDADTPQQQQSHTHVHEQRSNATVNSSTTQTQQQAQTQAQTQTQARTQAQTQSQTQTQDHTLTHDHNHNHTPNQNRSPDPHHTHSQHANSHQTALDTLPRRGGLSRLETVLVEDDIDTVVLAFRQPDRAEFFGALDTCQEHGVGVKVHRQYADSVLVSSGAVDELVDVDLEPWDPFDHFFKRIFDVIFALIGLVVFAPIMVAIAAAIKLDSPGPVLYSQARTAGFGETFPIYKFRTMIPEGETAIPTTDEENDRITRVGHVLRRTHLDELPQLWSILLGEMSVVGPRAVWTDEEPILEQDAPAWRKRWFVKPGLTGLAQINGARSTDPNMKLRYDLEYIRTQSIWIDCLIVIRQVWMVIDEFRS
ncbi:sugar transferase [Natrialba taiwanensis]|uniref:sugar transferase n=1 Tax=Natrialba taiwanensis TaxID=160846 RepID=UPI001EF9D13D|nr:sugar transferase [Natrialba taiwanensis]